MNPADFLIIAQSETIRYKDYSSMPIGRVELYRNLVQLRMVYHDGGFRSHLDLMNKALYDKYLCDATCDEQRGMFNLWNMPALNAFLAVNPLIDAGYDCMVINNFDAESDILFKNAREMRPPIIGISTTFILQWAEVGRIAKAIRSSVPDAIIIIGGAFTNSQYLEKGPAAFERPLRKYGISYALFAFNSEMDLLSLMNVLKNKGGRLEDVNNLVYFKEDGVFEITQIKWNEPVLNREVPFSRIMDTSVAVKTVQVRTASGCPFRCGFCSYPVTSGGYHKSSLDLIRLQLDEVNRVRDVEAVVFIDDTMNIPEQRFRQIVSLLKEYDLRWYSFYRVQYADEALARDLRESGCDGLYLGLESANDGVLRNMNKRATADQYARGIEVLKNHEIPLFGMFIVGYPGETEDTVKDNIEFVNKVGLDYYSAKEFYYLHTAPVHLRREEFGLVGEGYRWQHATMSSARATEMKVQMFEDIDRAVHIDPDLGLWYLAYLRDRGFTWSKINTCQNIINLMVHMDNIGKYDKTQVFAELCTALRS